MHVQVTPLDRPLPPGEGRGEGLPTMSDSSISSHPRRVDECVSDAVSVDVRSASVADCLREWPACRWTRRLFLPYLRCLRFRGRIAAVNAACAGRNRRRAAGRPLGKESRPGMYHSFLTDPNMLRCSTSLPMTGS